VELVESAELVAFAESAELVELAESAELVELAESAELVELAESAELVAFAELVELVESAELVELAESVELVELVEFAELVELEQPQEVASGVVPKGQEEAGSIISLQTFKIGVVGLTITECNQAKVRATEDTRVGIRELSVDNTLQFYVPRRVLTVGRGRDDTINVLSVAGVLAVSDGVGDEGIRVSDVGRLGKVDHSVCVVLLVTGIGFSLEGVDTVDASESHTRLIREDVPTANKLYHDVSIFLLVNCRWTYAKGLPTLSNGRKVGLCRALARGDGC
jgi:hypothetical protein